MPGEAFMRLKAYGDSLYESSKGIFPVPVQTMTEIDALITICRRSAKTDEEKSIVSRTQMFWDLCFSKWYSDNPEEFEKIPEITKPKTKEQTPDQLEKAGMFIALKRIIRTLKTGQDLPSMLSRDFRHIKSLIDKCSSMATTGVEKKFIEDTLSVYNEKHAEWQELRKKKVLGPQNEIDPKFNFELNDADKRMLTAHQADIGKVKNPKRLIDSGSGSDPEKLFSEEVSNNPDDLRFLRSMRIKKPDPPE